VLFKAEAAAGALFGLLGVVTIFWRDWIEAIFGWDPDHHSGSLEWVIVAGLLLAAVLLTGDGLRSVIGQIIREDARRPVTSRAARSPLTYLANQPQTRACTNVVAELEDLLSALGEHG
jgi:hypothetical protein